MNAKTALWVFVCWMLAVITFTIGAFNIAGVSMNDARWWVVVFLGFSVIATSCGEFGKK